MTCLGYHTNISSALLAPFFHQGVNRWVFIWSKLFVFKHESFLYFENEILMGQTLQKCFRNKQIALFHLIFPQHNIFEFFCQGLNWRCDTFRWLLFWAFSYFFPISESWYVQMLNFCLMFIFCRSSLSYFPKFTILNSSNKVSVEFFHQHWAPL